MQLFSQIKFHQKYLLILLLTWGLFFIYIFSNIIEFKPDGVYLGHENVWSDWSLHIAMVNNFFFRKPQDWFANHPMYAGGNFNYTFLTNLISSLLMKLGFSLKFSMIIPSIIFSLVLIFSLYFLFYFLSKNKFISLISINIFFLSSGPGFLKFFRKYGLFPPLKNIFYPPIHFSRLDKYDWYAGNFLVGMLIPQRSFLLGLPIAVCSYFLLTFSLTKKNLKKSLVKKLLLFAGILAGILPVAHMHSFIVLIILSFFTLILYLKKWKTLLNFILPASILSIILYFNFLYGGLENSSFIKFYPGWTAPSGLIYFLKMWWEIWGFIFPTAFFGLIIILKSKKRLPKIFCLSLFFVFVLANLVLFQPVTWDNSKLFLWSYFAFAFSSAYFINKLFSKKNLKPLAYITFFLLTATGFLEIFRLFHTSKNQYLMTKTSDINLAQEIRQNTNLNDIFLTSPDHNHFIMIWANRPIMMGFTAWVMNFGFDYGQRERDIKNIFLGENSLKLIKKYNISYIVVGPSEKRNFQINQNFFQKNFKVAFQNQDYIIYRTK